MLAIVNLVNRLTAVAGDSADADAAVVVHTGSVDRVLGLGYHLEFGGAYDARAGYEDGREDASGRAHLAPHLRVCGIDRVTHSHRRAIQLQEVGALLLVAV